jgi:hypothetical protein
MNRLFFFLFKVVYCSARCEREHSPRHAPECGLLGFFLRGQPSCLFFDRDKNTSSACDPRRWRPQVEAVLVLRLMLSRPLSEWLRCTLDKDGGDAGVWCGKMADRTEEDNGFGPQEYRLVYSLFATLNQVKPVDQTVTAAAAVYIAKVLETSAWWTSEVGNARAVS